VRRVVDRVGREAAARTDLGTRVRPPAGTVPAALVVQIDGSMLPTRGPTRGGRRRWGWSRAHEHFVQNKGRGLNYRGPFVARVGDLVGFKQAVADALTLERADDARRIVVVGDGAPWVWAPG